MKYFHETISIPPVDERLRFTDITDRIRALAEGSSIKNGIATIYTTHTTCAIRINENEARLIGDLKNILEKLAPEHARYSHDDIQYRDCPPDERINGHSHCKAILLGASETIPLVDCKLLMGKYQSVFHIDLDGVNRTRNIEVCIMGQ
jgi:secondary thiamine-phosphate synthase enzyme